MSLQLAENKFEVNDPLNVLESVAFQSQMNAERVDQCELHINLGGMWRDIAVWFAWREDMRVLQMGAPLELKVPEASRNDIYKLLSMVNERVWLGRFDLWSEDNGIVYRNGTVLSEMADFDETQGEILIRAAVEAFERFFPAFNYVLWGGKTPEEAMQASLFDTAGSA